LITLILSAFAFVKDLRSLLENVSPAKVLSANKDKEIEYELSLIQLQA
jgi:hypothetical protein